MGEVAAILDFWSEQFLQFFINKLFRYFLPNFEPFGISVQKKFKIDFQDGGHLGFQTAIILAIFDLQVTLVFPSKFRVNWPFIQEKKFKMDFQDGGHVSHFRVTIRAISAISDLQVNALILPSKFQVNWPFGSTKEVQKISRWRPWRPSWSSGQNDFAIFYLQVTLMLPTKFLINLFNGSGGVVEYVKS